MTIRQTSYDNPLGLRLGEEIKYLRSCYVDYDSKGIRKVGFRSSRGGEHYFATVVGCVRRAEGRYIPGWNSFGDDATDGPTLKVSNYVRLYECKRTITDKPFMVHPDDIVLD